MIPSCMHLCAGGRYLLLHAPVSLGEWWQEADAVGVGGPGCICGFQLTSVGSSLPSRPSHMVVNPLTQSFILLGLRYSWSTIVGKYEMENSSF